MRVVDPPIFAYELEVEVSDGKIGQPIFTFNRQVTFEDVDESLRTRIRAYYASFLPHSNILNLSPPGPWSDWSDWSNQPVSPEPVPRPPKGTAGFVDTN